MVESTENKVDKSNVSCSPKDLVLLIESLDQKNKPSLSLKIR